MKDIDNDVSLKEISDLLDEISRLHPNINRATGICIRKFLKDYEISITYKDGEVMIIRTGNTVEEAFNKLMEALVKFEVLDENWTSNKKKINSIEKVKEYGFQLRQYIGNILLSVDDNSPMREHKELFEAANMVNDTVNLVIKWASKLT